MNMYISTFRCSEKFGNKLIKEYMSIWIWALGNRFIENFHYRTLV